MKDVIYRDVKKEDLCEFENLIKDAFNFDKFIHNK
ncbi:GNAT family N-acetyltransferase, partial [Clostridium perfringens]